MTTLENFYTPEDILALKATRSARLRLVEHYGDEAVLGKCTSSDRILIEACASLDATVLASAKDKANADKGNVNAQNLEFALSVINALDEKRESLSTKGVSRNLTIPKSITFDDISEGEVEMGNKKLSVDDIFDEDSDYVL